MDSNLFYGFILVFGIFIGMSILSSFSRHAIHGSVSQGQVRNSMSGIFWNATIFVAIVIFFCYVLSI